MKRAGFCCYTALSSCRRGLLAIALAALLFGCGSRPALVKQTSEFTSPTVVLECFLLAELAGKPVLLQRSDGKAWEIRATQKEHPHETVAALLTSWSLVPQLLHSTSWRHAQGALVITYLAVAAPIQTLPAGIEAKDLPAKEQVGGEAIKPPTGISNAAVLTHALRHLAWLYESDAAVNRALSAPWKTLLAGYHMSPFKEIR